MPSNRSSLVATLAVLGAVPTASGAAAIAFGPGRLPGGSDVVATVDSEYRFAHLFWGTAGPLLWWSLRQPEARSPVTRGVLGVAAAGGLARLVSWRQTGRPHPVFVGALVLELVVVPAVLVWHHAVVVRGPKMSA